MGRIVSAFVTDLFASRAEFGAAVGRGHDSACGLGAGVNCWLGRRWKGFDKPGRKIDRIRPMIRVVLTFEAAIASGC